MTQFRAINVNNTTTLCGLAGENLFNQLVAACHKLKRVKFSSQKLIQVANNSAIGRQRLALSLPYLLAEYGIPVRQENRYYLHLNWKSVPAEVILDYVYGIDSCVQLFGWIVALDITTNPNAVEAKQNKLQHLAPLWQALGIDRTAVFLMDKPCPRDRTTDLVTALRQVIKGQTSILVGSRI